MPLTALIQQHSNDIQALLPETLQTIAVLVGIQACLALVDALGGLDYDMPKGLDTANGSRLSAIVGKQAAERLIAHFGGERVYISRCHHLRLMMRNHAFMEALIAKMEAGISQYAAIQQLAPVFGITERRAYDIIKHMQNSRAQGLFDF